MARLDSSNNCNLQYISYFSIILPWVVIKTIKCWLIYCMYWTCSRGYTPLNMFRLFPCCKMPLRCILWLCVDTGFAAQTWYLPLFNITKKTLELPMRLSATLAHLDFPRQFVPHSTGIGQQPWMSVICSLIVCKLHPKPRVSPVTFYAILYAP